MENHGNTAASYTVKLLSNNAVPPGFHTQLILHRIYKTPAAAGCALDFETHSVLVTSIPNPAFIDPSSPDLANPNLTDGSVTNATVALAPGDAVKVTLRVYDPIRPAAITFTPKDGVPPPDVARPLTPQTL